MRETKAALERWHAETRHLTGEQFAELLSILEAIDALSAERDDLPGLGPIAVIESKWPFPSFRAMLEAYAYLSQSLDKAEGDIPSILQRIHSDDHLAPRRLRSPVPSGKPLGETLVAMGVVDSAAVDRVITMQREVASRIGLRILIGFFFYGLGLITYGEYYQALGIQFGVEVTGPASLEDVHQAVLAARQSL